MKWAILRGYFGRTSIFSASFVYLLLIGLKDKKHFFFCLFISVCIKEAGMYIPPFLSSAYFKTPGPLFVPFVRHFILLSLSFVLLSRTYLSLSLSLCFLPVFAILRPLPSLLPSSISFPASRDNEPRYLTFQPAGLHKGV